MRTELIVNYVPLEPTQKVVIHVNTVQLVNSVLLQDHLVVQYVTVVPTRMEPLVYYVLPDTTLTKEELVNFVQSINTPPMKVHALALLVVQELKLTQLVLDVQNVYLVNTQMIMEVVKSVQLVSIQLLLEPLHALFVDVVNKQQQIELTVNTVNPVNSHMQTVSVNNVHQMKYQLLKVHVNVILVHQDMNQMITKQVVFHANLDTSPLIMQIVNFAHLEHIHPRMEVHHVRNVHVVLKLIH